jgi:hypothetical protein
MWQEHKETSKPKRNKKENKNKNDFFYDIEQSKLFSKTQSQVVV